MTVKLRIKKGRVNSMCDETCAHEWHVWAYLTNDLSIKTVFHVSESWKDALNFAQGIVSR